MKRTCAKSARAGIASKNKNEHRTWANMKSRCNDSNHPRYKDWGGRGIKVCKRWNDFENFLKDMGKRPNGLTLGRISNDGNYEPKNCKWVTPKEQCANRRNFMLSDGMKMVCYNSKLKKIEHMIRVWFHLLIYCPQIKRVFKTLTEASMFFGVSKERASQVYRRKEKLRKKYELVNYKEDYS